MDAIYDLSWNETSFLSKLKLFLMARKAHRKQLATKDAVIAAESYSQLSSTYYSIASTGFAWLRSILKLDWMIWLAPLRIIFWCMSWLPLSAWCYIRMLHLSDKVVELIGYRELSRSPSKSDIRQSILCRHRKYNEAQLCILLVFANNTMIESHTRALLHLALSEIYQKRGYFKGACIELESALMEVRVVEKCDPRQAIRIYRGCAKLSECLYTDPRPQFTWILTSGELYAKAEKLAYEVDSQDQLLKA